MRERIGTGETVINLVRPYNEAEQGARRCVILGCSIDTIYDAEYSYWSVFCEEHHKIWKQSKEMKTIDG